MCPCSPEELLLVSLIPSGALPVILDIISQVLSINLVCFQRSQNSVITMAPLSYEIGSQARSSGNSNTSKHWLMGQEAFKARMPHHESIKALWETKWKFAVCIFPGIFENYRLPLSCSPSINQNFRASAKRPSIHFMMALMKTLSQFSKSLSKYGP